MEPAADRASALLLVRTGPRVTLKLAGDRQQLLFDGLELLAVFIEGAVQVLEQTLELRTKGALDGTGQGASLYACSSLLQGAELPRNEAERLVDGDEHLSVFAECVGDAFELSLQVDLGGIGVRLFWWHPESVARTDRSSQPDATSTTICGITLGAWAERPKPLPCATFDEGQAAARCSCSYE